MAVASAHLVTINPVAISDGDPELTPTSRLNWTLPVLEKTSSQKKRVAIWMSEVFGEAPADCYMTLTCQ